MSQINPMLLAALSQATAGQSNLPGPVTDESGQPVQDAKGGNKKDVSDFLTHWDRPAVSQQPATSGISVRHAGPLSDAIRDALPERKAQDQTQEPPTSQLDPTSYFSGQGTAPVNIPYSNFNTAAGQGVPRAAPKTSMQVPANLASNSQFQAELSHQIANGGDPQQVISRWMADSQTDVDKQNAAYDQAHPQGGPVQGFTGNQTMDVLRGTGPGATTTTYNAANPAGVNTTATPYDGLIKNAGLQPGQADAVRSIVQSGAKNSDIVQAVRDFQGQNHQADQQAREDFNGQRDLYKDDYESAQRDYDTVQKTLDTAQESAIGMANPASLEPLRTNVTNAKTAMDQAKTTWQNHVKQGPKLPSAPIQPQQYMASQVQQGGPPITVNRKEDLARVPAGSTIIVNGQRYSWDGQQATPQ